MEITGFDLISFIKNECIDVQFAGELHDNLRSWIVVNGTNVKPDEEGDITDNAMMLKAMNYFVPMEELSHTDLVVPTFCDKMKELSEKESEKHLFLKYEGMNIVIYKYGMGLFDANFRMICFVGDTAYEPDLEPIYETFVIKGSGYWEPYKDKILRLLANENVFEKIYSIWDDEYTLVPTGKLS